MHIAGDKLKQCRPTRILVPFCVGKQQKVEKSKISLGNPVKPFQGFTRNDVCSQPTRASPVNQHPRSRVKSRHINTHTIWQAFRGVQSCFSVKIGSRRKPGLYRIVDFFEGTIQRRRCSLGRGYNASDWQTDRPIDRWTDRPTDRLLLSSLIFPSGNGRNRLSKPAHGQGFQNVHASNVYY